MRNPSGFLSVLSIFPFAFSWEANWESLDSRPTPSWYDESKFGIFIHWGIFSVPSFGSEWFWNRQREKNWTGYVKFMADTERPNFSYQEYATRFDASLFEPDQWADLFSESGAQYVVLTSKHHEGFCNWDSRDVPATWNWNAMDIGPRRDLVGDLAQAVKNTTSATTKKPLHWGLYHSLYEWFHPAFLKDEANNFTTRFFPELKTLPELYDLVNKYEPELIWSDGPGRGLDTYWNATPFLAWYATDSPVAETAVWNDRWGHNTGCIHGSFWNCHDRYQAGHLMEHKWENALTIDNSTWGFSRNSTIHNYLSIKELVHELIETVAFGGNMLLNFGPGHDGTISPIFGDRLLGIGNWLKVNGESIYATKPWLACQNETSSNAFYTRTQDTLYAIVTQWPTGNKLTLKAPVVDADATKVRMVGYEDGGNLPWKAVADETKGLQIEVPALTPDIIPCQHAWVFAMKGVVNLDTSESSCSGGRSPQRLSSTT